jgi:hypothetical protein
LSLTEGLWTYGNRGRFGYFLTRPYALQGSALIASGAIGIFTIGYKSYFGNSEAEEKANPAEIEEKQEDEKKE